MRHSGSRGVGNAIGSMFIDLAKQDAIRNNANLPDKDLACFEEGARDFGEHVRAVGWAQRCAAIGRPFDSHVEAVNIIPGSMGARSFIVRGRGNAGSVHSCSHGAGRRMSRNAAWRQFTLDDHVRATEGVACRQDTEVIDERPAACKDIDAVMAAQADLVEVVPTLKQVVCVKG